MTSRRETRRRCTRSDEHAQARATTQSNRDQAEFVAPILDATVITLTGVVGTAVVARPVALTGAYANTHTQTDRQTDNSHQMRVTQMSTTRRRTTYVH